MKPSDTMKVVTRWFIDLLYGLWPRAVPGMACLDRCKIISHRGLWDNRTVFENSIAAFDRARDRGAWGIEFDIRWTRDLVPIVFHDRDMKRMFGNPVPVSSLAWSEVHRDYPAIPALGEVLDRYGKALHLMIEIKEEVYPDPTYQNGVLRGIFAPLEPGADFHLLSLQPDMFSLIDFVSPRVFLPIAELNTRRLSNLSIREGYGGIAGHYLMLTNNRLEEHRRVGQTVGTGFIRSGNCLFRELHRGIEWIFTNHAVKLLSVLRTAKGQRPA